MKLVRQPPCSNLCGQACIATVLNITLDESIELMGTKGKTDTRQLKDALDAHGVEHGDRRIRGFPTSGSAILWFTSDFGKHWVVWHNKKYYDPIAGVHRKLPNHLETARVTSHLPVIIK